MDQINSGSVFILHERRHEDPMYPPKLRRCPRAMNCISHMWHEGLKYVKDEERSSIRFMMFKSPENKPYYWWIDNQTNQICYDASSSIQEAIFKDNIADFEFEFL